MVHIQVRARESVNLCGVVLYEFGASARKFEGRRFTRLGLLKNIKHDQNIHTSSQVRSPGRLSGSVTWLEIVSWVATANARRQETPQLLVVVVHVIVVLRQASACI